MPPCHALPATACGLQPRGGAPDRAARPRLTDFDCARDTLAPQARPAELLAATGEGAFA